MRVHLPHSTPFASCHLLASFILVTALTAAAAPAHAQDFDLWCWEADEVHARVEGATIAVFHDATVYNCCPDPFEYEIVLEENVIRVREVEVLSNPCYCICCFDLAVTIEDVPPGDYTLEFTWYDYEERDWLVRLLDVSVPDAGQADLPAVGETYSSGCIEAQSVPDSAGPNEDDQRSPTWGRIKSLFD
ncbi:MAG: hypothetical protein KAY32_14800 [Candidatus Eisenbacteria sp.]|nr:hypothetical protein [Candidatus Eisenbacteria bacterium]